MGKSIKFRNIAKYTRNIASLIYNNQHILRYINYLTDTPLATKTYDRQGNIIEQKDLSVTLENSNIEISSFNEKILTKDCCKIFLYPEQGQLDSKNVIGDLKFIIDIIIPYEFEILRGSGEFRHFNIADEISELIDGQPVAGIGNVEVYHFKSGKLNDEYCFLTLFVRVNNMVVKNNI